MFCFANTFAIEDVRRYEKYSQDYIQIKKIVTVSLEPLRQAYTKYGIRGWPRQK